MRVRVGAILVHGGAGAPRALDEGCAAAAEAGVAALRRGAGALEAVVAAVARLEDDGRFNAGSGSVLRLDGRTVEMDAAVMDAAGTLGAVAALAGVRNPVLVARRVAETPHVLLAGAGAAAFARRLGFAAYHGVSPRARQRHEAFLRAWREGSARLPPRWRGLDLRRYWNLDVPYEEALGACDTVGAVALDAGGGLAVAGSTGGSVPMLRGRVGDTPLPGCGFFAGPHGAVAATGVGEEIIRRMLSRAVYDAMAAGAEPQRACEEAVAAFPADLPVGVIAIGPRGQGVAANVEMARAAVLD